MLDCLHAGHPNQTKQFPTDWPYINRVSGDDIALALERQLEECLALFSTISEEKPALLRSRKVEHSPGLNHLTDTGRAFAFRALWFGRGFDSPLPDYDQNIAAAGAEADRTSWSRHVEEFSRVRLSTILLFEDSAAEAWLRSGVASGNRFTVRALAYIAAGHVIHHATILRERYL